MARAVQRRADRADHAVHHAAGRDHVRPGVGVRNGYFAENVERFVVQDVAVAHDAAVPVIGVFAHAHVGHDQDVRVGPLDGARGLLDDAVLREIFLAERVFVRRHAEQDHRRDMQRGEFVDLAREVIDRLVIDARHRRDFLVDVAAMHHEQRVNEIGRAERRFAHHRAQVGGRAQAAQSNSGEGHVTGSIEYKNEPQRRGGRGDSLGEKREI